MKSFLTAIILSLFTLSAQSANAAECDPSQPSAQEVQTLIDHSVEAGVSYEVLEGDELQSFRQNIAKNFASAGREMQNFDKHIFFAKPGAENGMVVLFWQGCVVNIAEVPVELYVLFRTGGRIPQGQGI